MSPNEDVWNYSETELRQASLYFSSKINIELLFEKINKEVESCNHYKFSHKTTCPFHKNGAERTASLYFSEERKDFICFSCRVSGNSVDLMARLKGVPWQFLVADLLKRNIAELDAIPARASVDHDLPHRIDLEVSGAVRAVVDACRGTPEFERACQWADRMFYRIDERLACLQPSQVDELNSLRMQISLDIQRFSNAFRNHR